MPTEEAGRLEEEIDCLRMKCEELNHALRHQVEENKKMSDSLDKAKADLEEVQREVIFLQGKVAAYEFVFEKGGG